MTSQRWQSAIDHELLVPAVALNYLASAWSRDPQAWQYLCATLSDVSMLNYTSEDGWALGPELALRAVGVYAVKKVPFPASLAGLRHAVKDAVITECAWAHASQDGRYEDRSSVLDRILTLPESCYPLYPSTHKGQATLRTRGVFSLRTLNLRLPSTQEQSWKEDGNHQTLPYIPLYHGELQGWCKSRKIITNAHPNSAPSTK